MNWRKAQLFLLHDLMGSDMRKAYDECLAVNAMTNGALRKLTEERLQSLLEQAAEQIPFYRKRVKGNAAALSDFPIVSKADLRTHFDDFMSPSLAREFRTRKRKAYSWVEVKSGGSTGVPARVIHDRLTRDYGRAAKLFSNSLCGFPVGTPYIKLWGSLADINRQRTSFSARLFEFFQQALLLNAFRLDSERMQRYARIINDSRLKHMMAYNDVLHQLALYCEQRQITMRPLATIMGCATLLTPDMRRRIENVFGARIHNKYGTRECGEIACQCSHGGMHIFNHWVRLEVVDKEGRPLAAGQAGRILVTMLMNHSFPLIRYEIGDWGSTSERGCACGSPLPLLENLEGRSIGLVVDTRGNYVTPHFIIHLIGVCYNPGSIRRFQFVQSGAVDYELLIETEAVEFRNLSPLLTKVADDLRVVLGEGARIRTTRVDEISESASGKFQYVRNEYVKAMPIPGKE